MSEAEAAVFYKPLQIRNLDQPGPAALLALGLPIK
jgi:hypothetical protein